MSGVVIEWQGIETLVRRLNRMALADVDPLIRILVTAGESQTRRRIEAEKRSPDGQPWADWSPGYAETRHGGQSLLEGSGHLLDSIASFVDGEIAGWGSNLVYAAIHQFGGLAGMAPGPAAIPARQYIGVSADDHAELQGLVDDWVDGWLGQQS
jgi:phage virion morphogenesis protein